MRVGRVHPRVGLAGGSIWFGTVHLRAGLARGLAERSTSAITVRFMRRLL